jgi:two-component system NtrC family sensor kinase
VTLDHALTFFEERLQKRGIKIEREFQAVPAVIGDPDRLQQALLNLIANACDAMTEGGILRVRLGTSEEGREVFLALRDTGTGIPSDELTKIFEPFFTTKDRAQGTGLGLFVVRSIIFDHGGRIEVESSLGEGTEFQIWLPVAPPPQV